MTTQFTIIFVGGLLCATQALAHPPWERFAGSFTRSDGVTVSAIEHYVDGILGADPVSVQFRSADGTLITQTEQTRDNVVVRRTVVGLTVYRYPNDWLPVASSVLQFDGFLLRDNTTSCERWFSPFVHTRAHWEEYAVILGLAAVFVAIWFAARAIPKRGGLAVLRVFAFIAVGVTAALCVLLVLFAASASPFIVCIFGGICFAICFLMRRFIRHGRAA